MRQRSALVALAFASMPLVALADPPGDHDHDHRSEAHRPPAREPPPKWEAHAPGVHPRGATVRSHPVRILAPRAIVHGRVVWKHWEHPEFVRPVYYWNWREIHSVSCIAEDSYGDQYPVTMTWRRGYALDNMTEVEDSALDRCYDESGADDTCYLASCSHY